MIDKKQLLEGMVHFSSGSLHWCGQESERTVIAVVQVMDHLIADANRISHLSKDTLDAIQSFRDSANQLKESGESNYPFKHQLNHAHMLIEELNRLTHEHEEIHELTRPILNGATVPGPICTANSTH